MTSIVQQNVYFPLPFAPRPHAGMKLLVKDGIVMEIKRAVNWSTTSMTNLEYWWYTDMKKATLEIDFSRVDDAMISILICFLLHYQKNLSYPWFVARAIHAIQEWSIRWSVPSVVTSYVVKALTVHVGNNALGMKRELELGESLSRYAELLIKDKRITNLSTFLFMIDKGLMHPNTVSMYTPECFSLLTMDEYIREQFGDKGSPSNTMFRIGWKAVDELICTYNATHCSFCNRTGAALMECTRCRRVTYCDQRCQRYHWVIHKPVCMFSSSMK